MIRDKVRAHTPLCDRSQTSHAAYNPVSLWIMVMTILCTIVCIMYLNFIAMSQKVKSVSDYRDLLAVICTKMT